MEKSHKNLALPLSSSTPRINKPSETRKIWSHSSPSGTSTRTSSISQGFDEPATDSTAKFIPHSSSSSSSEQALPKISKPLMANRQSNISTNLKSAGNVTHSPRRQTVHYDVSPVSMPASPKPGFGTLPLQSPKGRPIHGSSSSPRLQASECFLATFLF